MKYWKVTSKEEYLHVLSTFPRSLPKWTIEDWNWMRERTWYIGYADHEIEYSIYEYPFTDEGYIRQYYLKDYLEQL